MSSPISTRGAPSSNPGPRSGEIWRAVEAQHRVSTMKLVDDPEEQRALEALIEATKPQVPPECRHLHWLLYTPFRYAARADSRFRRRGRTPAVFYASEHVETAIAEIAFWRLLFFIESPATPFPANPLELTAFSARYRTAACLDLTRAPYAERAAAWTDPADYGPCHAVADEARAAGCGAIRARSARDPAGRINVALLACTAFREPEPRRLQTWRLRIHAAGIAAVCHAPAAEIRFDRKSFAHDPRVRDFDWDR